MNRYRLVGVGVVAVLVLVVGGLVIANQITRRQARDARVSEMVTALESERAASATPPALDQTEAARECQAQYSLDYERGARRVTDPTFAPMTFTEVSEGLYSMSGTVAGPNMGGKQVEDGYSCTARLDGTKWVVEIV